MAQLTFFEEENHNRLPVELVDYKPSVFTGDESNHLLEKFIAEMPWVQRSVLMYGKEVITPRLTAWIGDPDVDYAVSGNVLRPLQWTEELLMIKKRIEPLSGVVFNSVLLNYYRNGNDSVSWHSDNDGVPGRNHIVASVSFGQVRRFDIRNNDNHAEKYSIDLENGSYLLMKGDFQDHWQHRIAKSSKPLKERVNLTFRVMPKV